MRRLLLPALTSAVMLALTLGLGIWQVHRLHWKRGLLAEIDRAEAAPPVPLPANPVPFEKVEVSGRLRADLAAHYGAEVRWTPSGPAMGSQLLEPLERPGAPPLLVDLGWLPDGAPVPAGGDVTLTGYMRPAEPAGLLTPAPDLTKRQFWSLDPAPISAALSLPNLSPWTLVVLGPDGASPQPAHALPRPPNDHLGYAITWFSLSGALVIVFVIFARKALRA